MEILRQTKLLRHGALLMRYYSESAKPWSQEEIQKAIAKEKIVVFMKGVPEEPRCGFSNAVVQILRMHGVKYDAYNVLENEKLRQAVKDFSQWPTIPQVYVDGNFIGGCDILLQMHHSGDLIEELGRAGIKSALLSTSKKENN